MSFLTNPKRRRAPDGTLTLRGARVTIHGRFLRAAALGAGVEKDSHDISHLRWVMSGAAPVPVPLIKAYEAMGIEIHQVYGLTETCGPDCLISPDDALTRVGSTGKTFFHTEARVVNEQGNDCGPDEPVVCLPEPILPHLLSLEGR